MCNNTCTASNWLAQLASLLFVLIHLLIAIKMQSNFGDATFTFKIDPEFNFEMNNKNTNWCKRKWKILKKISTTPDDLT